MRLKYALTVGALACGLVGVPAPAQTKDRPKSDRAKNEQGIVDDLKDAGKATGRAAKKTGKKVKHGAEKVADETVDGTKKVVKKGAEVTEKGVHEGAKATEKGAEKVRKETNPDKR